MLLLLLLLPLSNVEAAGQGSVGVYSVSGANKDSKLNNCLLQSISGINLTSLCAANCRANSKCESFSFNDANSICHLHSATAAAAACQLAAATGWVHFDKNGFRAPDPAVGACLVSGECKNGGSCLSRTEVAAGSKVCACPAGFEGDICETEVSKPKWSAWSDFGDCSVTCGVGLKMQQRRCQRSGVDVDAWQCGTGSPERYEICNTTVCPSWSSWSAWSKCTTGDTCGEGVKQRSRSCSNGGVIGKDCLGSSVENTPCASVSCSPDTAPLSLKPITYEPYVVGKGFVRIFNNLDNVEGYVCSEGFDLDKEGIVACRSMGFQGVQAAAITEPVMPASPTDRYFLTGLNCQGTESSLQACQHAGWKAEVQCSTGKAAYVVCKVDGKWSQWSAWESCEGKCGSAQRNRTRACRQPKPLGGGSECSGAAFEESPCPGLSPCPVDGKWQEWSNWSACSVSCGGGVKNRSRICTSPAHGGRDCSGSAWQSESCASDPCPVNGQYQPWSEWTSCDATCGGGSQRRSRVCVQPQHGGLPCDGVDADSRVCNPHPCPVAGNWSSWSGWQSCNVSCGGGSSWRQRECDSPAPQHGGDNCLGNSKQSKLCNTQQCPVNGYYTEWKSWSECSLSCGGGQQQRQRSCVPPKFGGADCVGESEQNQACKTQPCPIPGEWQSWQAWGHCSQTCKGGVRLRYRQCNMTSYGEYTSDCVGVSQQSEPCNSDKKCLAVRSCQDLKNSGLNYDLETEIDPDGDEGSIAPFKVKCILSNHSSNGITVIENNMTLPGVYAQGQEAGGSIHIKVPYSHGVTATALNALARMSGHCSQYVRYTCHDAGIHYQNNVFLQATYWVNHQKRPMLGWGQPYSMRTSSVCACHASGTCGMMTTKVGGVDSIVPATCNCDRNERKPNIYDEGHITDRDNLPVNEVWVGDTGDAEEYSYTFVGPLTCWGLDPSAG